MWFRFVLFVFVSAFFSCLLGGPPCRAIDQYHASWMALVILGAIGAFRCAVEIFKRCDDYEEVKAQVKGFFTEETMIGIYGVFLLVSIITFFVMTFAHALSTTNGLFYLAWGMATGSALIRIVKSAHELRR